MATVKVLLADDHAIVSQGLEALLKQRFDLVGTVGDGRALVAATAELLPDVVVTDISMPGLNGLDAIRQIKKANPHVKLVVLTMHAEPNLVAEALKAGASGYLLKTSAVEELETAINEVLKGRTYVTSLIAKDVFSLLIDNSGGTGESDRLTSRQREVLQLIAEGRTMKEVAAILNISPRTAESHKYEMMSVLGCQTTADLIHYAIKMKLVSP
ncbi:MAG TPA: response regulator transcription factor [Bryobacteraceae bacterium]|nr:response regulator transcription factor [Bryobacteraceae bacterium]